MAPNTSQLTLSAPTHKFHNALHNEWQGNPEEWKIAEEIAKSGPDDRPIFTCSITVNGLGVYVGRALTDQAAKDAASELVLKVIGYEGKLIAY